MEQLGNSDLTHALSARFCNIVQEVQSRTAVIDAIGSIDYVSLSELSTQYARVISNNVPIGAPVAICMKPSRYFIAAILGALQTGRPYVPLDPSFPADRLAQILRHSGAKTLACSSQEELSGFSGNVLKDISLIDHEQILAADHLQDISGQPDSPAYIIYTSGSTGNPKGVWQNQRGLIHDILQYTQAVHIGPADRISLLYSPSVNGALRDIFGALLNGATLCVSDIRDEGLEKVTADLKHRDVTVLHAMPPILRSIMRTSLEPLLPSCRILYTAGDRFLKSDLIALRERLPETCEIYTGIGSTECATLYRHWIIPKNWKPESELVPVGYGITDRDMYLLDGDGNAVPDGQIGRIVVCSDYIAQGYWKNKELDQLHFKPEKEGSSKRCFEPGDLGRIRSDGLLEFLGRKDRQIKVNGYRVEPAEIEGVLRGQPGISECAVLDEGVNGRVSLVACVQAQEDDCLTPKSLLRSLAEALPAYMLPRRIVILERFPRTANLKIDVNKLKASLSVQNGQEPSKQLQVSPVPKEFIQLWERILRRTVNVDSTLEEIGVDSLELLELDMLIEREFKKSVHASLHLEATPRQIWERASLRKPAPAEAPTRALAKVLKRQAVVMSKSRGAPLDPMGIIRYLNQGGSRMPLVWCFNQGYEADALAKALGPDQPLYAMRSMAGLYDGARPDLTMERQLSETYAQILFRSGIASEVVIGGNCQAAWISMQLAYSFYHSERTVPSTIFLEKYPLVPYGGRSLLLFGEESARHNPRLRFVNPSSVWKKYLPNGEFDEVKGTHGEFFSPENIGSLAGKIRSEIDTAMGRQAPLVPLRERRVEIKARRIQKPEGMQDIVVMLRNSSSTTWGMGAESHINITGHLLKPEEKTRPNRPPDISVPLSEMLAPNADLQVVLGCSEIHITSQRLLVGVCENGYDWFEPTSDSIILV